MEPIPGRSLRHNTHLSYLSAPHEQGKTADASEPTVHTSIKQDKCMRYSVRNETKFKTTRTQCDGLNGNWRH